MKVILTIHCDNGTISYRPRTSFNGKIVDITPCIPDEEEAAKQYDLAILKYFNGQGKLNFPQDIEKHKLMIANGWKSEKAEAKLEKINSQS